jgi:hypothetical protein
MSAVTIAANFIPYFALNLLLFSFVERVRVLGLFDDRRGPQLRTPAGKS